MRNDSNVPVEPTLEASLCGWLERSAETIAQATGSHGCHSSGLINRSERWSSAEAAKHLWGVGANVQGTRANIIQHSLQGCVWLLQMWSIIQLNVEFVIHDEVKFDFVSDAHDSD